jgi:O-antigen ligase
MGKILTKERIIYLYYLFLLLILTSWKSDTTAPPMTLRFAYLAALVIPAIINERWLPAVITCFTTVSIYGYAYSYMPTMIYIYTGIVLVATIICSSRLKIHIAIPKEFVFLLFYVTLVNLVTGGEIEEYTYSSIIVLSFMFFMNREDRDMKNKIALAFSVSSLVLSIFFFTTFQNLAVRYGGVSADLERGGWTDPNYFGMVVGMGTIASMNQLFSHKKLSLLEKILYIVTISISVIVLVMNASRGSILSVVVGAVVLLSFSELKRWHKVLIILLVIVIYIYLYKNRYLDLLLYRFHDDSISSGGGRTDIWERKLEAFWTEGNPLNWLFGFGYTGGGKLGFSSSTGFHNDYIGFLVEFGFVGIICFLYMLFRPLINFKSKYTRNQRPLVLAACLYLAMCGISLEPITAGGLTYLLFYYYIIVLSQRNE